MSHLDALRPAKMRLAGSGAGVLENEEYVRSRIELIGVASVWGGLWLILPPGRFGRRLCPAPYSERDTRLAVARQANPDVAAYGMRMSYCGGGGPLCLSRRRVMGVIAGVRCRLTADLI